MKHKRRPTGPSGRYYGERTALASWKSSQSCEAALRAIMVISYSQVTQSAVIMTLGDINLTHSSTLLYLHPH